MARMSEAEKQKSHARIIDAAARLFRKDGIGATSVSDVMQAAGLTHGGFYRHFSSKENLIEAAFAKAVDDLIADMETSETETQREQSRKDYISRYLSLDHAKNAGGGCPLATMGAEISRFEGDIKSETSKAIKRTSLLLDQSSDRSTAHGTATMAMLVGIISVARLAETEDDALQIIAAGKAGLKRLNAGWT